MYRTKEIKQNLIESCVSFNAKKFLPYLLSSNVTVEFPSKIRFYSFFKDTLEEAKNNSVGSLDLKIEKEPWEKDKDLRAYNFYDELHRYPRINLQVKEKNSSIFIHIMPF